MPHPDLHPGIRSSSASGVLDLFLACGLGSGAFFGRDGFSGDWVSLWPLSVPWNKTFGCLEEETGVDVLQDRGGVGGLTSSSVFSVGNRYDLIIGSGFGMARNRSGGNMLVWRWVWAWLMSTVTSTLSAKSGQKWVTALVQCLSSLPPNTLKYASTGGGIGGMCQGCNGSCGIAVSGGGILLSQLTLQRVKIREI